MTLMRTIRTGVVVVSAALSMSAVTATFPTSTQSTLSENGDTTESGLKWWQILLLVIGGFLVFTCWGCYFFFKHRENQQAKFKPVATTNGDDPRVRFDSNTVKKAKEEQADIEDAPEQQSEQLRKNSDTHIVLQDEIVIEKVDEDQPIASTSDYKSEQGEIPAGVQCGSISRYAAMDDDDLEYQ